MTEQHDRTTRETFKPLDNKLVPVVLLPSPVRLFFPFLLHFHLHFAHKQAEWKHHKFVGKKNPQKIFMLGWGGKAKTKTYSICWSDLKLQNSYEMNLKLRLWSLKCCVRKVLIQLHITVCDTIAQYVQVFLLLHPPSMSMHSFSSRPMRRMSPWPFFVINKSCYTFSAKEVRYQRCSRASTAGCLIGGVAVITIWEADSAAQGRIRPQQWVQ